MRGAGQVHGEATLQPKKATLQGAAHAGGGIAAFAPFGPALLEPAQALGRAQVGVDNALRLHLRCLRLHLRLLHLRLRACGTGGRRLGSQPTQRPLLQTELEGHAGRQHRLGNAVTAHGTSRTAHRTHKSAPAPSSNGKRGRRPSRDQWTARWPDGYNTVPCVHSVG
jgi:hypothetical protein